MLSFRSVLHKAWTYFVILFCLGLFFSLSVNLYVRTQSESRILDLETAPETKTLIVLGASVFRDGSLTPVLEDRMKTAVLLYRDSKAYEVLVTGDGESAFYNEVVPMKAYLEAEEVPEEAIIVDPGGIDTYRSLRRAKEQFGINQAIIVSQEFHLYRAVYIARSLGIDAVGVPAIGASFTYKDIVREFFATVKSVWMVVEGKLSIS